VAVGAVDLIERGDLAIIQSPVAERLIERFAPVDPRTDLHGDVDVLDVLVIDAITFKLVIPLELRFDVLADDHD
jgi:hypothetical protein